MQTHPSSKYLYKRVRLLTNLGEHQEAQALFEDLQARSFNDPAGVGVTAIVNRPEVLTGGLALDSARVCET